MYIIEASPPSHHTILHISVAHHNLYIPQTASSRWKIAQPKLNWCSVHVVRAYVCPYLQAAAYGSPLERRISPPRGFGLPRGLETIVEPPDGNSLDLERASCSLDCDSSNYSRKTTSLVRATANCCLDAHDASGRNVCVLGGHDAGRLMMLTGT